MSSTKKESREEANEDSEEQDVTEAGRVFQRIEQEGRKEDRWAEVEHKGTSIDLGFRRLYLQREAAEESLSWRQGGPSPWTSCQKRSSLLRRRRQARVGQPRVLRRDILGSVSAEEWE